MTLGDKIRTVRKMKGLSQENLAEMLSISSTAYAKIERNETNPSNTRIDQIAKALNMQRTELQNFGENGVFYLNESNNNNTHSIFLANSSNLSEMIIVVTRLEAENNGLKNENEQLKKIILLLEEKQNK